MCLLGVTTTSSCGAACVASSANAVANILLVLRNVRIARKIKHYYRMWVRYLLVTGLGLPWRLSGIVIMSLLGVTTTSSCGAATSGSGAEASSSAGYLVALFFLFLHVNKLVHSKISDEINIDHYKWWKHWSFTSTLALVHSMDTWTACGLNCGIFCIYSCRLAVVPSPPSPPSRKLLYLFFLLFRTTISTFEEALVPVLSRPSNTSFIV